MEGVRTVLIDNKTKRARSSNPFLSVINSWLERMVVVQTATEEELEIKEEIMKIRMLLDE